MGSTFRFQLIDHQMSPAMPVDSPVLVLILPINLLKIADWLGFGSSTGYDLDLSICCTTSMFLWLPDATSTTVMIHFQLRKRTISCLRAVIPQRVPLSSLQQSGPSKWMPGNVRDKQLIAMVYCTYYSWLFPAILLVIYSITLELP